MDKLTDGDTVKAATVTPTSNPPLLKPVLKDGAGVPINIGDYVTFYDKMSKRHRGIIRWIGTNPSQPDGTPIVDNTPIVGIEVVSDIQTILCTTKLSRRKHLD